MSDDAHGYIIHRFLPPPDNAPSKGGEWLWFLKAKSSSGARVRSLIARPPGCKGYCELHVQRQDTTWAEGPVPAWNGDHSYPTLLGSIKHEDWHGWIVEGELTTDAQEMKTAEARYFR